MKPQKIYNIDIVKEYGRKLVNKSIPEDQLREFDAMYTYLRKTKEDAGFSDSQEYNNL